MNEKTEIVTVVDAYERKLWTTANLRLPNSLMKVDKIQANKNNEYKVWFAGNTDWVIRGATTELVCVPDTPRTPAPDGALLAANARIAELTAALRPFIDLHAAYEADEEAKYDSFLVWLGSNNGRVIEFSRAMINVKGM